MIFLHGGRKSVGHMGPWNTAQLRYVDRTLGGPSAPLGPCPCQLPLIGLDAAIPILRLQLRQQKRPRWKPSLSIPSIPPALTATVPSDSPLFIPGPSGHLDCPILPLHFFFPFPLLLAFAYLLSLSHPLPSAFPFILLHPRCPGAPGDTL